MISDLRAGIDLLETAVKAQEVSYQIEYIRLGVLLNDIYITKKMAKMYCQSEEIEEKDFSINSWRIRV